MRIRQSIFTTALVLCAAARVGAQTAVDVSGHWEGAVRVPGHDIAIEVDLGGGRNGELIGTFNNPGENLKGFPLSDVSVNGRSVRFVLNAGQGGGPFTGTLAADGQTIEGEFTATTPQGPKEIPFTLARRGAAILTAPPVNPPIGKELLGEWRGTIEVGDKPMTVIVKLANRADGTSAGTAATEGGNAEIPITTIAQNGSSVVLEMKIVGGVYTGTVSADGATLEGTWKQAGFEGTLNLRKRAEH